MMKPEPSEVALRGRPCGRSPRWFLSKKSLKNSSNGDPGGNCGRPDCPPWRSGLTVWVVEMLTTDGSSFSAKSAKLSGAGRAAADGKPAGNTSSTAATATLADRRNRDENNDTFPGSSQATARWRKIKLNPGKDSARRAGGQCPRDPIRPATRPGPARRDYERTGRRARWLRTRVLSPQQPH